MEWYTLDDQLRRDQVIEGFESFIWSERYSSYGDFQIVTKSTYNSRTLLAPGTRLTKDGSTYISTVETVEDDTADDGTRNITVTGRMLEALLDDRVAMSAIAGLTATPNWVLTGKPADIVRAMFTAVCFTGVLSNLDTIPFYHPGTLLPSGNIPEPSSSIVATLTPDTLYNATKTLCDAYGMGFRLVRNGELGQVYFEVYMGSDRTSGQTVLPAVIFDTNMENLTKISQLSSTVLLKTVAYVFAANGCVVVYAPNSPSTASGSDRKVLLVNSNNSSPAGPTLTAALQQEGLVALASQRIVYSFDGELPQSGSYIYGVDYHLGDLVEERNSDGFGNLMVVTEQIFVSDNTGERSYPTLSISQLVTPGSWLAWSGGDDWSDVSASVHWADL